MRQAVRSTLHTATRPANGRLSQLMPPAPPHKKRGIWMRHLAPVALLLIILLSGFGMQQWNKETNGWNHPVPTHQLSTATMTNAPTATQTAAPAATATHPNASGANSSPTPQVTMAPQPITINN